MSEDNNYSFRQPNQQIKTTAKPTNKKKYSQTSRLKIHPNQ